MSVATLNYQEPGKVPSVVLALLVHVLLAAFLFFGVRWQSKHADAVEVELWTSLPTPVAEQVLARPEPMPEPVPEVKPAPIPEVKPELKLEKVIEPPKPDIALEKKPKKEPPKVQEPPKKAEPRPDRTKDIRAQLERELAPINQQLEKERINDQIRRESAAKADALYSNAIKSKIRSNIVLPSGIPGNPEAIFDVVQLPTGEVLSAKLRKSSGYKAYDEAVERAILKSSPLPKAERAEQFHRDLEIKFKPLD
jgi:colicin import membrane protein